jgi:hypothetical protein
VLRRNYGVDLDSFAPDWGVTFNPGGGAADIKFQEGDLPDSVATSTIAAATTAVDGIVVVSGAPTYDKCLNTEMNALRLTPEQTVKGTDFCIKTSQSHIAAVEIVAVGSGRSSVSIQIVSWN